MVIGISNHNCVVRPKENRRMYEAHSTVNLQILFLTIALSNGYFLFTSLN